MADTQAQPTGMTEAYEWRGRDVVDSDGQKLGRLEEIYLDQQTELPEWAIVQSGMFGKKLHFVPLRDARPSGESIQVRFTKNQVGTAPSVEADGELSQDEEATLYEHYGFVYSEDRSDSGLPEESSGGGRDTVGRDVSGPETDDAMTRSEEELHVGTASRERGRARLKKYVVTEQVHQTVPVSHEEVRIEREPITDANREAATSGKGISDEEHEVVLHEEQVVTEKRTVPKERVRMDKETVTGEETVSEEVRKEQIHADSDEGRRQ